MNSIIEAQREFKEWEIPEENYYSEDMPTFILPIIRYDAPMPLHDLVVDAPITIQEKLKSLINHWFNK